MISWSHVWSISLLYSLSLHIIMRAVNSWRSVRVKCNEVWTYVRCLNNAGHSGAHVPGWHLQWLTALRICFMLISPCLCLPCRRSRVTTSVWQSSYHIILRKGISDIWEAATLDKKRYYSITSIHWIELLYSCMLGL